MGERFQVVVIGSGPGGGTAARRLARAGLSVAIIESADYGGTCPNRGCDPKSVLRAGAELAHRSKALATHGITKPAMIDWNALMRYKRGFTAPVPDETKRSLSQMGVETIIGHASFINETTVQVGERTIEAQRFIIATGALPRHLAIEGAQHLATSDDILDLDEFPEHALFVGGGYVSFELAHILNACGVICTIVYPEDEPLPAFEAAIVRMMLEASRSAGIELLPGGQVVGVEQVDEGYHVHVDTGDEHHTYETDIVVHGAGRVANTLGLGLENTNVRATRKGIIVDAYLRASEHIYAIGDCTSIVPSLTPVAQLHGLIAAGNIIGETDTYHEGTIPTVLFTLPEVASVGLTSREANEQGIATVVASHETSSWFTSRRIGEKHAGSRILIDPATDRILGAHLIGEGSAEAIHLFALAIREGITQTRLKSLVCAFPTKSSDVRSMF